jgi:hypothetical protein
VDVEIVGKFLSTLPEDEATHTGPARGDRKPPNGMPTT